MAEVLKVEFDLKKDDFESIAKGYGFDIESNETQIRYGYQLKVLYMPECAKEYRYTYENGNKITKDNPADELQYHTIFNRIEA